jgi:hypothetical protein
MTDHDGQRPQRHSNMTAVRRKWHRFRLIFIALAVALAALIAFYIS